MGCRPNVREGGCSSCFWIRYCPNRASGRLFMHSLLEKPTRLVLKQKLTSQEPLVASPHDMGSDPCKRLRGIQALL